MSVSSFVSKLLDNPKLTCSDLRFTKCGPKYEMKLRYPMLRRVNDDRFACLVHSKSWREKMTSITFNESKTRGLSTAIRRNSVRPPAVHSQCVLMVKCLKLGHVDTTSSMSPYIDELDIPICRSKFKGWSNLEVSQCCILLRKIKHGDTRVKIGRLFI